MVCAYTNTPSTNTVNSNGILVARVQSSANDTVSQNTLIIPPGTLYACFALNVPYIVIPLHPSSRDLDDSERVLPRSPMARVTFLPAFLISTALTHVGRYDIPVLSAEQLYPP